MTYLELALESESCHRIVVITSIKVPSQECRANTPETPNTSKHLDLDDGCLADLTAGVVVLEVASL